MGAWGCAPGIRILGCDHQVFTFWPSQSPHMRGGGWTSEIHDFFKNQEEKKGAHRQDLKGLPNPASKSHPAWNALLVLGVSPFKSQPQQYPQRGPPVTAPSHSLSPLSMPYFNSYHNL